MKRYYTKPQRRAIAGAFRYARAKLLADRGCFICLILTGYEDLHASAMARQVVCTRMGTVGTSGSSLEAWLVINEHAPWSQLTATAMRDYRVRWLTALIEEFES